MPERRRYIVAATKIEPERRDTYAEHAAGYLEHHGGDDGFSVAVGETARYSVELDQLGAEAFRSASNLLELEEAVPERATEEAFGRIVNGVDRDMLAMHGMLDLVPGALRPLLLVADTGDTNAAYVASRRLERWTWFSDDGMGRNSHGPWCLGAATPPVAGRFVVSAKVLSDSGSGSNAFTIAALYRFARLCRDRGVPGIASLSLGSKSASNAYREAIAFCIRHGVAVIAAAGNDSFRDRINYPAAYCASVGAHDRRYAAAGFSNRAPGLPDAYALGVSVNGIGGTKSGTSMATPGVARAIWYAMSRGTRAAQVESRLRAHNGASRVLDAKKLMPQPPKSPGSPGGARNDRLFTKFLDSEEEAA